MPYKAVIFDLDGTLVHTAPECRYTIVGNTLNELGITAPNEAIDMFWFRSGRSSIIRENFRVEPDEFWKSYEKYDTVELRRAFTKLYDDVGFINEIRKKDYKTGIVTGAPAHIASLEIEILGGGKFDAIVIARSSNGISPKPHQHGLEECLRLLGASKKEAVYVGNADEDILTARNAGVFDILLDRGEHAFPGIKPSLTIHTLYDLRSLLGL